MSTDCISSRNILPTGMPVQAEITSPTICASTQTRISGVSPCNCSSSAFSSASSARRAFGSAAVCTAAPSADACAPRRARCCFQLAADFADLADQVALLLPAPLQFGQSAFHRRLVFRHRRQPLGVIRAQRGFALQNARLHGAIVDLPRGVFDRRRRRVLPQRQARARRIQNADRLVGQLAVGQIAVRELDRRRQPLIQNAHVVMLLQHRDQAAQHHQALGFGRLFHLHHLEAPRQRRIFFEVLLVFRPRGGGDGAQFAARQRRLQQVGRIVLARPRRPRRSWCALRR